MEALSHKKLFSKLDGARIEGRLEIVTQRQKEIQKIHTTLQASERELLQALQQGWSEEDALLELSNVLQCLRTLFGSHNIRESIANELLIATSKQNLSRRKPLGTLLIIAESAAPVAQSIVPLCLAIAEGNTALVILSYATPATSALLRNIILHSVDQDAITALKPTGAADQSSMISAFSKLNFHAVVVQSSAARTILTDLALLQNSPDTRIIRLETKRSYVIVTRNSDLEKAASDIAQAKFSFYAGAALPAPRLVMVDEFVLDAFLGHLEKSVQTVAANRSLQVHKNQRKVSSQTARIVKSFSVAEQGGRVVNINGASGETLLIGDVQWSGVQNFQYQDKVDGEDGLGYADPVLPILPTTSMDAAMIILNQINSDTDPSALFIFSNPTESRYLSLFATSTTTYLNHIPLEVATSSYPAEEITYVQQHFGRTHIIHTAHSSAACVPAIKLQKAFASGRGRTEGLKALVREVLAVPVQRSGAQVGFFPQGGILMLGHLFVLLSLSITGVVWGCRSYLKRPSS